MFRKITSSFLVLVLLITLSGCATILKDKETQIAVHSNPEGAEVFLGEGRHQMRVGRTPAVLTLENKDDAFLTFRKDGYEETTYVDKSEIAHGWMLASFICLVVPAIMDLASKNARDLREKEIKVTLDPVLPKQTK